MSSRRRLPIRFKDAFALGFRNPRPGIRYRKTDFVVAGRGSYRDSAAFRCELDCVIDQIGQNLEETIVIDVHRRISFNVAAYGYRLTASLDASEFANLFCQVLSRMFLRVQGQLS